MIPIPTIRPVSLWRSLHRILMGASLSLLSFGFSALPAAGEHTTPSRLEREAQVQSNSGHYNEARQLRAIAEALRHNKDAVVSKQVEEELQRNNLERAKEILRLR